MGLLRFGRHSACVFYRLGRWAVRASVLMPLAVVGCSGHSRTPASPPAPPTVRREAPSTPAYTGPHPDIAGQWQVTSFTEEPGDVYTCLDNDATVAFSADGSWQAVSRMEPHEYGGAFLFTAGDRLTLVTGVTQYYRITVAGSTMTLDSGQSLHAVLQRLEATPTPTP
jgi:hypothetical protein